MAVDLLARQMAAKALNGGGGDDDNAVVYAGGHDSVIQNVTSIPGESTVRTNEVNDITNFGTVLGERNHLGYTTDDNWSAYTADSTHGSNGTAVTGGANIISQTEDSFIFGYKNRTYAAHQSIVGGYKSKVYASESAVFGERHTVNGTLYEENGDIKTNTRRLLVYGSGHTVSEGVQDSFIGGRNNTAGSYMHFSVVNGQGNTIGNNCEWIQVFGGGDGYGNIINNNVADSSVFGWSNTIYGGADSSHRTSNNYVMGHDNTVENPSKSGRGLDRVYLFGRYLRPAHSEHFVLGAYNGSVNEEFDVLSIGCGTDANNRSDCFGTGINGNSKYIRIGDTLLTEAQLQSLLNLI